MTMTPKEKLATHSSLLTGMLFFVIVFGYKMAAVLGQIKGTVEWNQPQLQSDLLYAIVYGLVAFGLAIGVNFGTVLRGLGIPLGAVTAPPAAVAPPEEEKV